MKFGIDKITFLARKVDNVGSDSFVAVRLVGYIFSEDFKWSKEFFVFIGVNDGFENEITIVDCWVSLKNPSNVCDVEFVVLPFVDAHVTFIFDEIIVDEILDVTEACGGVDGVCETDELSVRAI